MKILLTFPVFYLHILSPYIFSLYNFALYQQLKFRFLECRSYSQQ